MADTLTPVRRSALMSNVKGKNTDPEMRLRKALHRRGYRYRLHTKILPGRPDISFPGRKIAVFVHGCFWHRHPGCKKSTTPKTRTSFWKRKFSDNVKRDRRNLDALEKLGWRTMVIWECETEDLQNLIPRIEQFLASG